MTEILLKSTILEKKHIGKGAVFAKIVTINKIKFPPICTDLVTFIPFIIFSV